MAFKSEAFKINLARYHVDIAVDAKYAVIQDVMSKYFGIMERLNIFLKELSHPRKNWRFIIHEARTYDLDYFHLFRAHPRGPEAIDLFINIFFNAIENTPQVEIKTDAVDHLLQLLLKIIENTDNHFIGFLPVLNRALDRIRESQDDSFFLFLKSYYPIKRLATALDKYESKRLTNFQSINLLLTKSYRRTYGYWLSRTDPCTWFKNRMGTIRKPNALKVMFKAISHKTLHSLTRDLKALQTHPLDPRDTFQALLLFPGYNQIVEQYRKLPQKLLNEGEDNGHGSMQKVIFLFHIMNISGLSTIHEEALRDINRTVGRLIKYKNPKRVRHLLKKTFTILGKQTRAFPTTALDCILNMGKGIYKTENTDLVNYFIDAIIRLGFQAPMLGGVDNNWQIQVNQGHLKNIRTWLALIEINSKWSTRLISSLIIHLSVSGVFIKDTDLFFRDVTRLLNGDIATSYNLVKQLTRLFPVYFNEIGAEGKLREISTRVDEITNRKDILIHFLRKQSHVESSNQILKFMAAIFSFWETKEKEILEPFVPPDIYCRIENKGIYIDGVHRAITQINTDGLKLPDNLVNIRVNDLKSALKNLKGVSSSDVERIELMAAFYKLLNQKYNLNFIEIENYLDQTPADPLPGIDQLKKALKETDASVKLPKLLTYLEKLKQIILSTEQFEIREDIYKKRHFALDIPSMYGSYRERKFDALGLTFRIESLVNVLFEERVDNMDLSLITKATFYDIHTHLALFERALAIDGISSIEFKRQLHLLEVSLEVKGFTLTQYLDLFKGFLKAVNNIVSLYFDSIHKENLRKVLKKLPADRMLEKYLPVEGDLRADRLRQRVSEIFFRDQIALSLGLQQLDRFLTRIITVLFRQSEKLSSEKLRKLLLYDPQRAMMPITKPNDWITDLIYLGNKGYNLVKLKQFNLPVPPGFIITTEVFRCREVFDIYEPANLNYKQQISQEISRLEHITGKVLGDPKRPLLLSVRSGAAISQPGMMDTFLNVGINEEIAAGIADITGNSWFAWDNYRRFLQCYGMIYGLERDAFDAIIAKRKKQLKIKFKRYFTGSQMKALAMDYKRHILNNHIDILSNPLDQLHMAIKNVLNSWNSEKAETYRRIMGISDDWGTAVTVQAMVFGNMSQQSGTGVFFTHNPRWSGDRINLRGDFTIGNQGEDVVSGLVKTLPISIFQQDIEMRETDIILETHFPIIYKALEAWALELIEKRGWSPQEIEFTFEDSTIDGLYVLQSRDMSIRDYQTVSTFDLDGNNIDNVMGHGVGVSGGPLSGRVVFDLDEIDTWRKNEPNTRLILVRNDTVPEDILEVNAADGLLTGKGGVTSHAAVVAHQLGKVCVVGCGNLVCDEKEKYCRFNGVKVRTGAYISIDGREGSVHQGSMKIKKL